MAVNPYILAPLQAKKEKSIGAPLGNILTKGAGILGKFAQRNPALLLGLGSSLLSGKGFGPSLADAGKAQATANKYITDQEAAKQAAHLARLKYLNEVRKTDIEADAGKAQANKYITDQEVAKEAAHLARLKYLNEVRKTDIDEYRADTDRLTALNPSPGKPNTIKQSDLNAAAIYLTHRGSINNLRFPGEFKDSDKLKLAQVLALNMRELMDIERLSQKDALAKAFDIVENKGIVREGDGFSTLWGFGRSAEINPKGGGNSSSAGGNSFSEGHLITSPDTGDLSWVPN